MYATTQRVTDFQEYAEDLYVFDGWYVTSTRPCKEDHGKGPNRDGQWQRASLIDPDLLKQVHAVILDNAHETERDLSDYFSKKCIVKDIVTDKSFSADSKCFLDFIECERAMTPYDFRRLSLKLFEHTHFCQGHDDYLKFAQSQVQHKSSDITEQYRRHVEIESTEGVHHLMKLVVDRGYLKFGGPAPEVPKPRPKKRARKATAE